MKKVMFIVVLAIFSMLATPVFATGPTNVYYVPYNDNAWWHSGQYIGPEVFGAGTQTTIVQDDVTIVVGAIPLAECNADYSACTGTWLMWKGRYGANFPEKSWFTYKFYLNGSGPIYITYTDSDGTQTEEANEFIFFKVRYKDGVWETQLQTYK